MAQRRTVGWLFLLGSSALGLLPACHVGGRPAPEIEQRTAALLSPTSLTLQALTNTCGANQAQDFFQVLNNTSSSVKVSDITFKYWIDDTSGNTLVPSISAGGCLKNAQGCFHNVTGVKATATKFSPACGPDTNHQANWEITVSNTDSTVLAAGNSWANIQSAVNLSNFTNFVPGESKWFSPCLSGSSYVSDGHFAVYTQGNLVFSSGISTPSCRSPHGQQQLMSGHVPLAAASAPLVGPVSPSTIIRLAIGLPLKTTTPTLQATVQQMSDPNSPSYRNYLTPAAFTATYGASTNDYNALVAWVQANGLTVTKSYPNRLLLDVSGTAAAVERALYVNLFNYLRPDGTVFYSPDREPSIDLSTLVLFISNLNNFDTMKPSATGSGSNGFFQGNDFRRLYASCVGLTGTGQSIGIFSGDGFSLGDIMNYASSTGISQVPPIIANLSTPGDTDYTQCVPVPGFCSGAGCAPPCAPDSGCQTTGSACSGGISETTLDIEMAVAMAPGASQIVVFEGLPNDMIHSMATFSPQINSLTSSWGLPHDPNTISGLLEVAAQGQTFLHSSGDSGSEIPPNAMDSALDNVTYVGGTVPVSSGTPPAISYLSETAWPGSGGWIDSGNSQIGIVSVPIPAYQVGIDMTTNGGSTVFRNEPDLSMPAWFINEVYQDQAGSIAGTSLASPLLAGFIALANQQSSNNGIGPVGFLNPLIYDMGKVPAVAGAVFHDMTALATAAQLEQPPGTPQPADYPVVPGYDLVTGWGSPRCALINRLATLAPLTVQHRLVAGDSDTCTVVAGGGAKCWGRDSAGQLGNGEAGTDEATPTSVQGLTNVVALSAGGAHTCAVVRGGALSCWGLNSNSQLGDGTTTTRLTPVPVPGLPAVAAVAAGGAHTCALVSGGAVWCWGDNDLGQVGDGTNTTRPSPVPVSGLTSGVVSIAVGGSHSCALLSSGSVMCWGQLTGDGTDTDRNAPVAVQGLTRATAISAGETHTCALLPEGVPTCWGDNVFGAIGDGTANDEVLAPEIVPGLLGVTEIAAGGLHTCAVLGDGTVSCWGENDDGQVGDGTELDRHSPTPVLSLTGVTALTAGQNHNCATVQSGAIMCWGTNFNGELGNGQLHGDGATMDSLTPVAVQF